MRNAFAEAVTLLAEENPNLVLLTADIGNRLFDRFKLRYPDRFYNCGVAESNMISVAAGLALCGLRPITYTITPFTTTRPFEQIRVGVCYHNAPVIIVGTGAGLAYAELGPTHHSLEDLAILRTLPGMKVLAPCDSIELNSLLKEAVTETSAVYIRIGKKGEPILSPLTTTDIKIGKAHTLRPGRDLLLLATGTIMQEVLLAGEILQEKGIVSEIVSVHTIKPLDQDFLRKASRFKLWVVVEEHGRIGGLGSAISEWRCQENVICRQINLGLPDEFIHEVGSQEYMRRHYGLNGEEVAKTILYHWDRL